MKSYNITDNPKAWESRPARGAWVEIECGVLPLHHPAKVAPRKGRVG